MRRLVFALLLLFAPAAAPALRVEEVGNLAFSSEIPGFGGLSGLVIDGEGTRMQAVGDRGILVTARIGRVAGRIAAVEEIALIPLSDEGGAPVTDFGVDAEGLAPDGAGGVFVSFEAEHRIWHYPAPGQRPVPTRPNPAFAGLQRNSGLEALACGPDGTLYAIPERSGALDRPFPVFRLRKDRWDRQLAVPRRGDFLVTGADVGPDGLLYVLERDFSGIAFASRIRRFRITDRALTGEELVLDSGFGRYGNLEGISAWRDAEGMVRLTLVADDNFSAFQSTRLVEFRLLD